jgi:hypothetical protein
VVETCTFCRRRSWPASVRRSMELRATRRFSGDARSGLNPGRSGRTTSGSERSCTVWSIRRPVSTPTTSTISSRSSRSTSLPRSRPPRTVNQTLLQQAVLLEYVAFAGVRHPQFSDANARWRGERGWSALSRDDLQQERLDSATNGLAYIRKLRWQFIHSRVPGPRFILNDLGWSYIGQDGRDGRALLVPLNRRLCLLGWISRLGSNAATLLDHADLRPPWVRLLNAGTWAQAPEFVIGHSDDARALRDLGTVKQRRLEVGADSPYIGSSSHLIPA